MTTIDEKEILEIEKFKAEIRNFNNNIEDRNRQYFISTMKLAFTKGVRHHLRNKT